MNDTDIQVTLARLETTISALTSAFTTRMNSLEEKMDIKLQNIIEKMDAQQVAHDKDIGRVQEMTEQTVAELNKTVIKLEGRVKDLEDAPAQAALKTKNELWATIRGFVFKCIAVALVGIILLVVGTAVIKNVTFTPEAKAIIEEARK